MAASSKPGGDLMRDGDHRLSPAAASMTDEATTRPSGSPLASIACSAGARSDQASCSHRPQPGRSARARRMPLRGNRARILVPKLAPFSPRLQTDRQTDSLVERHTVLYRHSSPSYLRNSINVPGSYSNGF
eukprot:scaffold19718_cov64-Phaeocystis_antarctica.AAC.1